MNYIVKITASGQCDQIAVDEIKLEDLQKHVGGWVTTVPTVFPPIVAICDEEGLMKQKPENRLASKLIPYQYGHLVGDVLFCKVLHDEIVPLDEQDILKVKR